MAGIHFESLSVPPNIVRLLLLVCSLLAFALIASWKEDDLTYHDLSAGDYDALGSFDFYIAVAVITFIFSVLFCIIVLLDFRPIPPLVDLIGSMIFMAFWFISGVLLAVKLTSICKSLAVREARLDFTQIEGAVAMGFICSLLLLGSAWFALMEHRRNQDRNPSSSGHAHLVTDLPRDILS